MKECDKDSAHNVLCFGTGFFSKKFLIDLLDIDVDVQHNVIRKLLLDNLCDLPGCDGVLHCHCRKANSLQCLSIKAAIWSLIHDKCGSVKGVNLSYFGAHWFSGYVLDNYIYIKASTEDFMAIAFLMADGAKLCKVYEANMGWIMELKSKTDDAVKELMTAFTVYINRLDISRESGVVNVLGLKLMYGVNLSTV